MLEQVILVLPFYLNIKQERPGKSFLLLNTPHQQIVINSAQMLESIIKDAILSLVLILIMDNKDLGLFLNVSN